MTLERRYRDEEDDGGRGRGKREEGGGKSRMKWQKGADEDGRVGKIKRQGLREEVEEEVLPRRPDGAVGRKQDGVVGPERCV